MKIKDPGAGLEAFNKAFRIHWKKSGFTVTLQSVVLTSTKFQSKVFLSRCGQFSRESSNDRKKYEEERIEEGAKEKRELTIFERKDYHRDERKKLQNYLLFIESFRSIKLYREGKFFFFFFFFLSSPPSHLSGGDGRGVAQ